MGPALTLLRLCSAAWGSPDRRASVGVSGGAWACFGVWVSHSAYSCAVTSAELPTQWPGAASVPKTPGRRGNPWASGAQLQLFRALGYLIATYHYCGNPGALDRASGRQHSKGDATLAWPVCPCHPHPFPVCKEETLGSPSNAAGAWLGLLLALAIRCLSDLPCFSFQKQGSKTMEPLGSCSLPQQLEQVLLAETHCQKMR